MLAAILLGAAPVAALAQANVPAPPTRDELVPAQPQPDDRRTSTLTIDGEMARSPCALDSADLGDIRVTLTQVSFVGAEAATDVDLGEAYAPYMGRDLPLSVLCDIRARATTMLTQAGYLAAVEIPEQRLAGGAAELRVVLGRLTALRVRGDAGPSERLVARYLDHLVGQPVFNTKTAERYLLLADDIPGLDVRLALRPAANGAPGELIGEVAVLRTRMVLDANVQNFGSHALGRFGGLLRAEAYDLTGMGDRTSVSVYSTYDFQEQQTLQIAHDMLVGSEGLSLGGQITLGQTHPTLGLAGFDVKSKTVFATVHAAYPFIRTQTASLYGSTGIDVVNQTVNANTVNLSRDHVRTAWIRVDGVQTDLDSVARRGGYTPYEPRLRTAVSLEVRQGLGILGSSPDCRRTPAVCITGNRIPTRIEQDPTPFLMRAEYHAEFRPVPLLTFAVDLVGQYTNDPLPAFEEMSGGNYSIGRGYDPGSVTGDKGVAATLELRGGSLMPKSLNSFALQPFVFVDRVTAWDRDPSQRFMPRSNLLSVGGGLRFTYGRGAQGELALAVPTQRTRSQVLNGQRHGDVRILFSLTSRLLPWRY